MKIAHLAGGSLLLALTALVSTAAAQREAPQELGYTSHSSATGQFSQMRLYGGPRFGFGGELEFDPDNAPSTDDDLLTTFGFQLGFDYGLHDYFAAGLELRFAGINTDARDDNDIGRDFFFDIALKPRGRYQFSGIPLELYVTLPFGLTFINTNDDMEDLFNPFDVEVSQGPAFNLGIGGGATYFFTNSLGVNLELIGLLYWYGYEADPDGIDMKFEGDEKFGQFTMMTNLVYAFE